MLKSPFKTNRHNKTQNDCRFLLERLLKLFCFVFFFVSCSNIQIRKFWFVAFSTLRGVNTPTQTSYNYQVEPLEAELGCAQLPGRWCKLVPAYRCLCAELSHTRQLEPDESPLLRIQSWWSRYELFLLFPAQITHSQNCEPKKKIVFYSTKEKKTVSLRYNSYAI